MSSTSPAPSRERRTQAERRAAAEASLIETTVRMIAERGLERFTLAEVGIAAGYSAGLPAHYFGKKEALIAAAAAELMRRFAEERSQVAGHLPQGLQSLLATVRFFFEVAAEAPAAVRAYVIVMTDALHRPELAGTVAEMDAFSTDRLEDELRAGIERGDIRPLADVRAQAMLILGQLRGALGQWLVAPDRYDLRDVSAACQASLRRALATDPGED